MCKHNMNEKKRNIWGNELVDNYSSTCKNRSYEIYRHISMLSSYGIRIKDILLKYGINNVCIYGYGEMGNILIRDIYNYVKVGKIYDKNKAGIITPYGMILFPETENLMEDEYIIVTPANYVQEISFELISLGVDRRKIIALDTLLTMYLYGINEILSRKQFLITGAQFHNKGAQSMLFVSVDQLKKKYPECIIWYLPVDNGSYYTEDVKNKYDFLFLTDGCGLESQVFEIANGLDAIIDISGYALSSYWRHEWYLSNLRLGKNYGILMYLMPQSFGPFDFDADTNKLLGDLLQWPKVIMAREDLGYNNLVSKYNLQNVCKRNDIVLESTGMDSKNIYKNYEVNIAEKHPYSDCIAIIPNVRIAEFTSWDDAVELYYRIADYTLKLGKTIYFLSYADDERLCDDIIGRFPNKDNIVFEKKEMDCLEISKEISCFDYIISSRYHACVHSLKRGIPCVVIGWSEKYNNLMEKFGQTEMCYSFKNTANEIIHGINVVNLDYVDRKEYINNCNSNLACENCFDIVDLT